MEKRITGKHFILITAVALIWTLIVIGFSTSIGARPLRMYDWSPPVFSWLITMAWMWYDRSKGR